MPSDHNKGGVIGSRLKEVSTDHEGVRDHWIIGVTGPQRDTESPDHHGGLFTSPDRTSKHVTGSWAQRGSLGRRKGVYGGTSQRWGRLRGTKGDAVDREQGVGDSNGGTKVKHKMVRRGGLPTLEKEAPSRNQMGREPNTGIPSSLAKRGHTRHRMWTV